VWGSPQRRGVSTPLFLCPLPAHYGGGYSFQVIKIPPNVEEIHQQDDWNTVNTVRASVGQS